MKEILFIGSGVVSCWLLMGQLLLDWREQRVNRLRYMEARLKAMELYIRQLDMDCRISDVERTIRSFGQLDEKAGKKN